MYCCINVLENILFNHSVMLTKKGEICQIAAHPHSSKMRETKLLSGIRKLISDTHVEITTQSTECKTCISMAPQHTSILKKVKGKKKHELQIIPSHCLYGIVTGPNLIFCCFSFHC